VRDSALIEELKRLLPQCLLPDQVRIGRRLAQVLRQFRTGSPAPAAPWTRWIAEAQASRRARDQRLQLRAQVRYPPELPITAHRERLLSAIRDHRVVVVAGETGSGKTTQIPKLCLEAGLGSRARIGCTQPRRLAAISISHRLADELDVDWGRLVGCKIRFATDCGPETSIKVMTDGILLAEIQNDPLLCEYEAVIIDEAHERSLNIDFLLGYLKLLLERREDLKLIITSATIDTARFSQAFDQAPVVEVSGRLYPVELRYRPLEEQSEETGDLTYIDAAVQAVQEILQEPLAGDSLVFLPSERDIREACDQLQSLENESLEIVPLFGRLTSAEQQRVFCPGPKRRIVLSTNIAETSLTVPRIRYVVDSGLARISHYQAVTRSKRLPIEPISQSSANQRKGRCGRLSEGICIRLYSEADFNQRPLYTIPEIQRCNLADVILRLKAHQLGAVETFPFLDPPSPGAIQSAYALLQELGALDESRELTPLGHELARLPADPSIGRMILQARHEHALSEVLVIAAGLSIQDPRERPFDRKELAEAAHRQFQDPQSDFLTLLNIWNAYHETWESLKTQNQLRKFCRTHFLSYLRMREWIDIHGQLEEALEELERLNPPESQARSRDRYAAIHRSILSGLICQAARQEENNWYRIVGDRKVMLFPGSTLFTAPAKHARKKGPAASPSANPAGIKTTRWIMVGEIVETSRSFARTTAIIDPEWIIELAPHLCRHTYHDPQWDAHAGRVWAWERVFLRGLLLRERRVSYAKINPDEAAKLFIQSALIQEDLPAECPFVAQNRCLRQKIEIWQTHLRQRIIPDLDDALYQFYWRRLSKIASWRELTQLIADQDNPEFLCATAEDLLGEHAADFTRADYPDSVQFRGQTIPVAYAYAPGEEHDGVTFHLTAPLVRLIDPEVLEWQVPALRDERVAQLLHLLPKTLRRRLMPPDETARAMVLAVGAQATSCLSAMSEFVLRRYAVEIPPEAWPIKRLPIHLQARFEVRDKTGKILAAGRDVRQLKEQWLRIETQEEKAAWRQAEQRWERYSLACWDLPELPFQVEAGQTQEGPLCGYLALQVEDGEVNLRLYRHPADARTANNLGIPRLAELELQRELAWLQKDLRALERVKEYYITLGPAEELLQTAWDNLREYLFNNPPLPPLTTRDFTEYLDRIRKKTPGLAPRLVDWVVAALKKRQELLLYRKPYPGMLKDLEALVPRQFLRRVPFFMLEHLPRYLQAMLIRAERAAVNPAKDREKFLRVAPYITAAQEIAGGSEDSSEARFNRQRFQWWVEEYKVSCFAQELGTAISLSPQKMDLALNALRAGKPDQSTSPS
jgi:ATP-dependent helicase HrpA